MTSDRSQLIQQYRRARERNESLQQIATPSAGLRHAAVLVPIVERTEGLHVLLIERAAHLRHHAGQIGFPGGAVEASDASPLACALREAEEEIGLRPNKVDVLGPLPSRITSVSSFFIQPFLALVHNFVADNIDANEVSAVFEVPLAFLLDKSHHDYQTVIWQGEKRGFHQIQYQDKRIWGATAGMIVDMSDLLQPAPTPE